MNTPRVATGIGAIFDGWRKLGYVPPEIENNKADKSFRLRLSKEKLVNEAQLQVQASLGIHLSEQEAAVLAWLMRKGQIDLADVKALTGLSGPAALALVQRLTVQVLYKSSSAGGDLYTLAEHLRTRFLPQELENSPKNQWLSESGVVADGNVRVTEQVTYKSRTSRMRKCLCLIN